MSFGQKVIRHISVSAPGPALATARLGADNCGGEGIAAAKATSAVAPVTSSPAFNLASSALKMICVASPAMTR